MDNSFDTIFEVLSASETHLGDLGFIRVGFIHILNVFLLKSSCFVVFHCLVGLVLLLDLLRDSVVELFLVIVELIELYLKIRK